MQAEKEINRRSRMYGHRYSNLIFDNLVCHCCARGVGKTWQHGNKFLCFDCHQVALSAPEPEPVGLKAGQEIGIAKFVELTGLDYLSAANRLVCLKESGRLERIGALRYRVVQDMQLIPNT